MQPVFYNNRFLNFWYISSIPTWIRSPKSFIVDFRPGFKYTSDEQNFLVSNKSYFKSCYFRYSHVLYRIATLEKSEKFDLLPHYFI